MKNILLVEDESELQKIIAFVLEREGYTVDTAPSTEEALSMCRHRNTDLIISDLQFGGMNALEFIRQVRSLGRGKTTPFVFLTGTEGGPVERAGEIAACIAKPFDVNDFVRTIKGVVPSAE